MKYYSEKVIRGFTLVEVLIVVAIIAILSAIAIPVYSSYITKSKAKTAQADLAGLVLNIENYFSQQSVYPGTTTTTAATKTLFSGWNPAQSADFTYTISASSNVTTPPSYTLSAVGSSTGLTTCTLTIDNTNARTATAGCQTGSTTW